VRRDYPSEHAAMIAVVRMLGIRSPETIRPWIPVMYQDIRK